MSDNGVTREGEALVKEWLATKERVARLAAELNRAQCERDNAEIALSKWLLPPDSVVGEKVAMSDDELYRLLERGTEEAVIVETLEAGEEVEQYAYDPTEET